MGTENTIDGSNILITGGTGGFGQDLVDYLLTHYSPNKIIILSRDEYKQNLMREKFKGRHDDVLRFFIGNVRDESRMKRAMNNVDYVINAAALRDITTCEYNPIEAIKTNINGAINVMNAAIDAGVKKVVTLSTDKSVQPISIYGSTKLVSDKLFIYGNSYSGDGGARFSVVRYGNIAGGRGSAISQYKRIINNGSKELPVPDFRMTRFWSDTSQAISLVVKALLYSFGGEIFVGKCPSFRIIDLAEAMLPGCEKSETGMEEGEKIHEALITKEDAWKTYEYEDCFIIYPHTSWWNESMIIPGGHSVNKDFEYTSAVNEEWIGVSDIKERLKSIDDGMII